MSYILENNIDDMSIFRNRIIFLMQENNIGSSKALAQKLYETNIITKMLPSNSLYKLKTSTIDKTIQKHLQDGNVPKELPDSLNAKYIQAYASVFNCSVDFILGNTHIQSPDPCIRDLCNRTGLNEKAVSTLLKMTDDNFAFRTLRISSQEARDILNSVLTSTNFLKLIHCMNNVACEFNKNSSNSLKELESKIGTQRINKALDWDTIFDPIYEGPLPTELELEDLRLLREAMDNDYAQNEMSIHDKQLAKYQLFKTFQSLIDNIYPD